MRCYVLSEGEFDQEFLTFLAAKKLGRMAGQIEVLSARGRSNAVSLSRSLLASRGVPVALVVDSDATDELLCASLASDLYASLAQVAPAASFHVLLAVPEIEAWLFADSTYLTLLLGETLEPTLLQLAEVRPKAALARWFAEKQQGPLTLSRLMSMIKRTDPARLLALPAVRSLMAFLEESIRSPDQQTLVR